MVPVKEIIFRADAGPYIGMGHFIRTLALAEMLNEHFRCTFSTKSPTEYQINEIGKVCKKRIDLPDNDSHFNVFLDLLKGDEIVVLDNYYFTTDYQIAIKAKGCKLVCIDDMHEKHFVADIVINHAEGVSPASYSKEDYTKLLLGFKYALLRSSFLSANEPKRSKTFSCLIIVGGADPADITLRILKNTFLSSPIAVVVGNSYKYIEVLESFKNVKVFKGIPADQILDLMCMSDFGIFPASTVAIEACAARLPFICGYYVENQMELYKGINDSKLAVCIDNLNNIDIQRLTIAINKIKDPFVINTIVKNQIDNFDKRAKKRFQKIFQEL